MQNFASSEKRYSRVLTPRYKQRIVFFSSQEFGRERDTVVWHIEFICVKAFNSVGDLLRLVLLEMDYVNVSYPLRQQGHSIHVQFLTTLRLTTIFIFNHFS